MYQLDQVFDSGGYLHKTISNLVKSQFFFKSRVMLLVIDKQNYDTVRNEICRILVHLWNITFVFFLDTCADFVNATIGHCSSFR